MVVAPIVLNCDPGSKPFTNQYNGNMADIEPSLAAGDFKELLEQARKASDMLKALSHEGRLLILCLLTEGEKSVSELEGIMELPQAAVSQQLARLRYDRLVTMRRDGRTVYYSIAGDEVVALVELLYQFFCKPLRDEKKSGTD